jgi:hypothetical protein
MRVAVRPSVKNRDCDTLARRAARSAAPSQRRSGASGSGEPVHHAASSRAVPAATVRAAAAATRLAPGPLTVGMDSR